MGLKKFLRLPVETAWMVSTVNMFIDNAIEKKQEHINIAFAHSDCNLTETHDIKNWYDELVTYDKFNNMCVDDVEELLEDYFPSFDLETHIWRVGNYNMFIVQFEL